MSISTRIKSAFTLSEILITLCIIGIVASMTLPRLVEQNQKRVSINKLKKAYSTITQAIKLSEASNGMVNTWDYGENNASSNFTENWFNTYLDPYMICGEVVKEGSSVVAKLQDGTDVEFKQDNGIDITFYLNTKKKSTRTGKDIFYYQITPNTETNAFRPYEKGATNLNREKWTTGPYACSTSTERSKRKYCAGLIMHDEWEFSKDYPW